MITADKWKWFGYPLHFCCADRCKFFMSTKIGKYIISTVGHLPPLKGYEGPDIKEINGEKMDEIGLDRTFETMVFKHKRYCSCGCGRPRIVPSDLDGDGYNTPKDAVKGHMKLCWKWAKKQ